MGCTHSNYLPLGRGYRIEQPLLALGKLRHREGHLLTRGLCLAELRQGPALSTRLKQRKTASHICVPSSTGSAWLGQQPRLDPPCLGGPRLLPPLARAAATPTLVKGEACTLLLAALVRDPPSQLSQSSGISPSPPGGCRQELAWAEDFLTRAEDAPSLCARSCTWGSQAHLPTHQYGAGVLQTNWWGQVGQRNPGD